MITGFVVEILRRGRSPRLRYSCRPLNSKAGSIALYCPGGVAGFLMVLAGVLVRFDVWTKPSVRVSRNATRSFSSAFVKPSLPMVIFSLFGSSGGGQQFTFSTVPARQAPATNAPG